MKAKFNGHCRLCNQFIVAGEQIVFYRGEGIFHPTCAPHRPRVEDSSDDGYDAMRDDWLVHGNPFRPAPWKRHGR